jgi:hypothetical protein
MNLFFIVLFYLLLIEKVFYLILNHLKKIILRVMLLAIISFVEQQHNKNKLTKIQNWKKNWMLMLRKQ